MPPSDDKASIRAKALAARDRLSGVERSVGANLAAEVADRVLGSSPGLVSVFHAIGSEIDTSPLVARLDARGIRLALPCVVKRGQALVFRLWRPGDTLIKRGFGLSEPTGTAELVEPDALIVPLAAFDRRGERIGYGAGFYDMTLARLRGRKRITAIGYAFACQEVASIPAETHDQPLDLIVTERHIIQPSVSA